MRPCLKVLLLQHVVSNGTEMFQFSLPETWSCVRDLVLLIKQLHHTNRTLRVKCTRANSDVGFIKVKSKRRNHKTTIDKQ